MEKIKKVLNLIITTTFLCQSIAFCIPDKDSALRLPMIFSHESKDVIDRQKNSVKEEVITKIKKNISRLSLSEKDRLIQNSWQTAIGDPNNHVIAVLYRLGDNGVKIETLQRFIDVLFGLNIDVANPWTASQVISDIIGYASLELLGENLSNYKPLCRETDFIEVTSSKYNEAIKISFDTNSGQISLTDLKNQYAELRKYQERLIVSEAPFSVIAEEIQSSSNQFVKKVIRNLLSVIWRELEIPSDSPAIIYFRNMKTFSSDVDIFYWGSKPVEVNIKLTELLFLLGFQRDLWSTFLITNEVVKHQIDFDIYHYFAMGQVIEINGASYGEFYQENIKAYADLDKMWQEVHPYLCRQLSVWQGAAANLPLTITDFKKVQFRGVSNLIFGLSNKFGISFGPDFNATVTSLESYLDKDEVDTIRSAIALANQSRNLLQIITRRRWENIDAKTLRKIKEIAAKQGVPNFTKRIKEIGKKLEGVRAKYFGLADFQKTDYLPLYTDERANKAWKRTAEAYLVIIHDIDVSSELDWRRQIKGIIESGL